MKNKYLSRKFIVTVISSVVGIVVALAGRDELVLTVAACAMTVLSAVAYTITEGRIDAESVRVSGDAISGALRENGQGKAADVVDCATDVVRVIVKEAGEPPDKS